MPKAFKILITGVAVAIVAVVAVILVSTSSSKKQAEEIMASAVTLTENNFDAVTYFMIAQLPPKPESEFSYDDYPEGTVPCDTSVFADYNALKTFIEGTYIPDEASRILGMKVGETPRYFEANGQLCKTIASPDLTYTKNFSGYTVKLVDYTKNTADVTVTVTENGNPSELHLKMLKSEDGKWFLEKMVY